MAVIKSKEDIDNMRESGKRLSFVLKEVAKAVKVGVNTRDLDKLAHELIVKGGDAPAFLNYTPEGAERKYPATLCVSVNNEVVHGIPTENNKVLREGDIVGLDLGLIHKGMITDMAVTVPVGKADEEALALISTTEKSLYDAIKVSKIGARIGDIGQAIVSSVGGRFSIVDALGGHAVGYKVHEEPYISNIGMAGTGPKIALNMALALEPILNEGGSEVVLSKDGYTFITKDGKRSAHFEHTILITENGPEILTL